MTGRQNQRLNQRLNVSHVNRDRRNCYLHNNVCRSAQSAIGVEDPVRVAVGHHHGARDNDQRNAQKGK